MGLHDLKDKKISKGGKKSFEELRQEAEALLCAYTSKKGTEGRSSGDPEKGPSDGPAENCAETHEAVNVEKASCPSTKTQGDAPSSSDAFSSSLEALRAVLRNPDGTNPDRSDGGYPEKPDGSKEPIDSTSDLEGTRTEEESVSALEAMPLPLEDPSPTPLPNEQSMPSAKQAEMKSGREREPADDTLSVEDTKSALRSALKSVREHISDVDLTVHETDPHGAPALPNPTARAVSDGIPESVSEALPKYPAKPRLRICNRCGHETRLSNDRCHRCGYVDASLGILDAVIAGDVERVMHILLVKPHAIETRTNRHGWTLLHMAAAGGNAKMAELLVSKGVSLNVSNKDGKTALHYAAGKGHLDIVKILLTNHADPAVAYEGRTPLDLAREYGRHEVAAYLKSYGA